MAQTATASGFRNLKVYTDEGAKVITERLEEPGSRFDISSVQNCNAQGRYEDAVTDGCRQFLNGYPEDQRERTSAVESILAAMVKLPGSNIVSYVDKFKEDMNMLDMMMKLVYRGFELRIG